MAISLQALLVYGYTAYCCIGVATCILLLARARFVLKNLDVPEKDMFRFLWSTADEAPDLDPSVAKVVFVFALAVICLAWPAFIRDLIR